MHVNQHVFSLARILITDISKVQLAIVIAFRTLLFLNIFFNSINILICNSFLNHYSLY